MHLRLPLRTQDFRLPNGPQRQRLSLTLHSNDWFMMGPFFTATYNHYITG